MSPIPLRAFSIVFCSTSPKVKPDITPAVAAFIILNFVELSFFASAIPAVTPSMTPIIPVTASPIGPKNFATPTAPLKTPLPIPAAFLPTPATFPAFAGFFSSAVKGLLSLAIRHPLGPCCGAGPPIMVRKPLPTRLSDLLNAFTPSFNPLNRSPGASKAAMPARPITKPKGFLTSNIFLKFSQDGSLKNINKLSINGFRVLVQKSFSLGTSFSTIHTFIFFHSSLCKNAKRASMKPASRVVFSIAIKPFPALFTFSFIFPNMPETPPAIFPRRF